MHMQRASGAVQPREVARASIVRQLPFLQRPAVFSEGPAAANGVSCSHAGSARPLRRGVSLPMSGRSCCNRSPMTDSGRSACRGAHSSGDSPPAELAPCVRRRSRHCAARPRLSSALVPPGSAPPPSHTHPVLTMERRRPSSSAQRPPATQL